LRSLLLFLADDRTGATFRNSNPYWFANQTRIIEAQEKDDRREAR
jgi:hypothetical protein